jgi:hypothetical protein
MKEERDQRCYCHTLEPDDRPCSYCWRLMYPEDLEDER